MIFNIFGRKNKETVPQKPGDGSMFIPTLSDRAQTDVSRGLTPEDVDRIMRAANSGDTADQCRLSVELEEKNWDIAHAVQTRRNAVLGIKWEIEPGDDTPAAEKIADKFREALDNAGGGDDDLDTFHDLQADLMTALLPGFAASEIIWKNGGEIAGFKFIEQRHFTFSAGFTPMLVTEDKPGGTDVPAAKLVIHKFRARGGDPARGGLIRPLAWLHCFERINVTDLLTFVERHGMPFLVAKVDQKTWEKERDVIQQLIRSFGPEGGGVFSKSTELELLQASNNTGAVYFKLLEYCGMAITKVVLGQTATAGDGGGWSNDNAQSQVRQDILESDCDGLAATVWKRLARPWTVFNYGAAAPVPRLKYNSEPPEDITKLYEAMKSRFDAMGVAIRAGILTATAADEEKVREILELPDMPAEAAAEWKRLRGVRLPITLQKAEDAAAVPGKTPLKTPQTGRGGAAGDNAALSADAVRAAAEGILREFAGHRRRNDILDALALSDAAVREEDGIDRLAANAAASFDAAKWLGPLQKRIDDAVDAADPEVAAARIRALAAEIAGPDGPLNADELAELIEKTVYAGTASGMADRAGALSLREDR